MQALGRLSVRDRAVVALRYLEDLSVRDVAAGSRPPRRHRQEPVVAGARPPRAAARPLHGRGLVMTIDQQLRDRFDRETSTGVPEPDLAAAIAAGRRRRRGRGASYAVGCARRGRRRRHRRWSLPRLGADPVPTLAARRRHLRARHDHRHRPGGRGRRGRPVAPGAARGVPERLVAGHPAALDADFANATEWQLVYELSPEVELLVYVSKPIPGEASVTCVPGQR